MFQEEQLIKKFVCFYFDITALLIQRRQIRLVWTLRIGEWVDHVEIVTSMPQI